MTTTTASTDPVSTYFDTTLASGSARVAAWAFPPHYQNDLLPAIWLFCIPGGTYRGLAYYDRQVPDYVPYAYSMARHLASNGIGSIVIDNLGTGQSIGDIRGEAITAETLAMVYKQVVGQLRGRLSTGNLVDSLAALPEESIWLGGVGHSMGSFILTHFQGRHPVFDAVVLSGMAYQQKNFDGMVSSFAGEASIQEIADMWIKSVDDPKLLPSVRKLCRPFFYSDDVPQKLIEADELDATTVPIGLFGDFFGATDTAAKYAAKIHAPVYLSFGKKEIPAPHEEVASYTGANDTTLFILEEAAHCTNFAPNRYVSWDNLIAWLRAKAKHTRPPLNRALGTFGG